jgi:two-component system, cell cycle response regulator
MARPDLPRESTRVEPPPALALLVARGLAALDERNTKLSELASIVEIDPVLAGSVLRVVRCPIYAVNVENLSLSRAVEMLGRQALERILRSQPVATAESAKAVEFACQRWTHGVAVAAAARWISNQGAFELPEEAYLAGLVHDVGRLVAPKSEGPRECSHRTEAIVTAWGLGPRVTAVARWHHALDEGVSPDSLVVDGAGIDPATARLLGAVARGSAFASLFGFGGDGLVTNAIRNDPDAATVREAIELELAHAAAVLGLPESPASGFAAMLTRHEIRARQQADADEALVFSHARTAVRVAALHRDVIDTRGMTAVHDMLERGLRAIHENLEFDRLILLEPDPAKELTLRTRLSIDPTHIEFERGPGGFELELEPGGAIARAIETELPCRGDDPDLDRATLERLSVSSFAAVPIRAGSAHQGVLVADQCFTGRPVTEGDTAVLGVVCAALGLAMENAALDAASKKLKSLAEKDELTNISNRRNILHILQREIDRARRYGKPLSLAMVDVDHFKTWNDMHGHHVGDRVLQSVVQVIKEISRDIDACGRYGGEEFLVVLPETQVDHAMLYGERLRAKIEAHAESLRAQYPNASLSVSVGISTLSPRGDDADRMIQRADAALYAAKKHGRNRVCVEMPTAEPHRTVVAPARGVLDEL